MFSAVDNAVYHDSVVILVVWTAVCDYTGTIAAVNAWLHDELL